MAKLSLLVSMSCFNFFICSLSWSSFEMFSSFLFFPYSKIQFENSRVEWSMLLWASICYRNSFRHYARRMPLSWHIIVTCLIISLNKSAKSFLRFGQIPITLTSYRANSKFMSFCSFAKWDNVPGSLEIFLWLLSSSFSLLRIFLNKVSRFNYCGFLIVFSWV